MDRTRATATALLRASLACGALASCASPPRARTAVARTAPVARHAPRAPWHPRNGPTIERLLNVHRAFEPSPSSDGALVAFLSDEPGTAQAFAAEPGDSPAPETAWRRVTSFDDRVSFVRFDPEDRWLWLGRDHGGDENTQLLRVDPSGEHLRELGAAPTVRHLFGALSADGGQLAYADNGRSAGDFDVYVRDADGDGEPRRVMEATGWHEAEDFSPDGAQLIVREERSSFDGDLDLVDVAHATHVRITHHDGVEARFGSPRFLPGGRALYVATDVGREFVNLAVLDAATGAVSYAIDDGHDVDLLALAHDGTALALGVNVDGWTEVRTYDASADPRHPRPLPRVQLPRVVVTSMAFSNDGRWLFLAAGRASMPDEVFRVELATGLASRVTRSDHAALDEDLLVEPVAARVRSFDGTEIPVLVYRPRDLEPGERVPVVVSVHGGPEGQATPSFNAVTQYLVGHGYMVVAPNVRGSTGYGKRFAHMDDVALREDSVRDLGEVNRWLRERPDVDPDRIAVMGGSYGGYMTLAAITLQPELWAAACDLVGIANFRTFLEHTAAYRRALREAEYGSLARDGELLDRISPIHRVDRVRAPLFVIHGTNDPRVPVGEAEQMVSALRARGLRVEYLRFDNEGHGLVRRENRIRAYGEMVRFFDGVMRGGG